MNPTAQYSEPMQGVLTDRVSSVGGGFTIRRPSLSERASQMDDVLTGLEATVKQLRDHLEPVLAPSVPEDDVVDAKIAGGDGSWLSDWLTSTAGRIQDITGVLRRLDARIDV